MRAEAADAALLDRHAHLMARERRADQHLVERLGEAQVDHARRQAPRFQVSAAFSASASRVPSDRIATVLPLRTTRPLPISSFPGPSGSGPPTPLPPG